MATNENEQAMEDGDNFESFGTMTVKGLKDYLRQRNLPVSGVKAELVARAKGAREMRLDPVVDSPDIPLSEKLLSPLGETLPDPTQLTNWSTVINIPKFTDSELYNFLVLSKHRTYAHQGLGARRALKARVFYEDGHISNVKYHPVNDSISHAFVSCTCMLSLPTTNTKARPDYSVWVCLSKVTGRIHSADCTCTAGAGESCNHIAALLYAMVDISQKTESGQLASTSKPCKWNQPRKRKLSPLRAREVNFQKFEWKRRKRIQKPVNISCDDAPTLDVQAFKTKLSAVCKNAAWLQNFEVDKEENQENTSLPPLHTIDFMYSDRTVLTSAACSKHFDDYFTTLTVSPQEALDIERVTRGQGNNALWEEARTGRVTASQFGTVIRRKENTPPDNLLKVLLGYVPKFETAATKWGNEHEDIARDSYLSFQQSSHPPITVQQCGFVVNPDIPHLGASPDGLVYCPHCKDYKGLLEIKCPYRLRNSTPSEAGRDPNFFAVTNSNGEVKLKRNHQYYFQIQGQMAISNRKYCDFVIWTNRGMNIERIYFDEQLWIKVMLPKLNKFYKSAVLPELFSARVLRKLKLL